jgi:hypothetical protein
MSVALRLRVALARVQRTTSRHVDLYSAQYAVPAATALSPKPSLGRATYSGLQYSRPDPETNTTKVAETDRDDIRERVVILGSGWAGMAFPCH